MRWWLALLACTGCDRAACTQDVGLELDVAATVSTDLDPVAPGVQTPVRVITTFAPGDEVTLSVNGTAATASVDVAGVADFGLVTVPMPAATLRASASSVCGAAEATKEVRVTAGATCALAFASPSETIARFAPLPVFNLAHDLDPAQPGEQAMVAVDALPGVRAEIRQRSGFGEESMGSHVVGEHDEVPLTLREGGVSLYAICSDGSFVLTSPAISAYVDSVAPACSIDPPIATATALAVTGRTPDNDCEGEPATLTVGGVDAHAGAIAGGQTHGSVPLPGSGAIALSLADHAHNPCTSTR